jgi:hypothetical protein
MGKGSQRAPLGVDEIVDNIRGIAEAGARRSRQAALRSSVGGKHALGDAGADAEFAGDFEHAHGHVQATKGTGLLTLVSSGSPPFKSGWSELSRLTGRHVAHRFESNGEHPVAGRRERPCMAESGTL